MDCQIRAEMNVSDLGPGESAGIAVRQSENDYATFLVTMPKIASDIPGGKEVELRLTHYQKGTPITIAVSSIPLTAAVLVFGLDIDGQDYNFGIADPTKGISDEPITVFGTVDGRALDTAAAGGFLGLWLGVYATSNGDASNHEVSAKLAYYAASASLTP
jgi:alpha-N-arabinofuranosidase